MKGHFLLTTGLLDVLESSAPSRVVNVSSAGHRVAPSVVSFPFIPHIGKVLNPVCLVVLQGVQFDKINDEKAYSVWGAYGQSKLCNILFANEIAKRYKDKAIYANSVHPGTP